MRLALDQQSVLSSPKFNSLLTGGVVSFLSFSRSPRLLSRMPLVQHVISTAQTRHASVSWSGSGAVKHTQPHEGLEQLPHVSPIPHMHSLPSESIEARVWATRRAMILVGLLTIWRPRFKFPRNDLLRRNVSGRVNFDPGDCKFDSWEIHMFGQLVARAETWIWANAWLFCGSEYNHLKNQIESEKFPSLIEGALPRYFRDLPKDEQQSKLKDRLKKYCQKVSVAHVADMRAFGTPCSSR